MPLHPLKLPHQGSNKIDGTVKYCGSQRLFMFDWESEVILDSRSLSGKMNVFELLLIYPTLFISTAIFIHVVVE